jgi:hypothetical protein
METLEVKGLLPLNSNSTFPVVFSNVLLLPMYNYDFGLCSIFIQIDCFGKKHNQMGSLIVLSSSLVCHVLHSTVSKVLGLIYNKISRVSYKRVLILNLNVRSVRVCQKPQTPLPPPPPPPKL